MGLPTFDDSVIPVLWSTRVNNFLEDNIGLRKHECTDIMALEMDKRTLSLVGYQSKQREHEFRKCIMYVLLSRLS